jgi:hypothetical protein
MQAHAARMSAKPRSGGFMDYVDSILNAYTIPNRTRDVISELTPNFVKNWRDKLRNLFSFGSAKTEAHGH